MTDDPTLRLDVFLKEPTARLPVQANPNAIGFDVYANLVSETGHPLTATIPPKNTKAIPTGLILKPPTGYYVQCCSRSGLAKSSIFVANSPGIIDPDYTGELIVLLFNGGYESFFVKHHYRIAQIILTKITPARIVAISEAPTSGGRGDAGFGSTGL